MANAHALHRSLAALTFGVARDVENKKRQARLDALGEREQQFQIDVSGWASGDPFFGEMDVKFGIGFVTDPRGQRDSDLIFPQVTFGTVYDRGNRSPIVLLPSVVDWDIRDETLYVGCTLQVGVWAPRNRDPDRFAAVLHMTIQGFGAPMTNSLEDAS
ncbi:MAG: hypothetical protein QOJ29_889 [Thermoleophilaceae bacterium]|jgi:hypothetical protein|nr:hypothetical protein [Thermoleophilaceae bacterium]